MNQPKPALPKQGILGLLLDLLMMPLMYLMQGTFFEKPQRTHCWNNINFVPDPTPQYDVEVAGDSKDASRRWFGFIPIFHLPILGGWREYVVLELIDETVKYHIGFSYEEKNQKYCKISVIPIRGRVRMLRRSRDTCFFAVSRRGREIPLQVVGYGRIGTKGPYSNDLFL